MSITLGTHLRVLVLAVAAALPLGLASPVFAAVGTIMFVVSNAASLDAQDTPKKTLMESWGYTVVPITDTASQAAFDSAALTSSVAYISETSGSGNVGTKLTSATIGVIYEEPALSDEFGMSASMTGYNGTQIDIINTTHYITSTLTSGVHTLHSSTQPMRYLSGTAGGYTTLGRQTSTTNVILAVMERGATLTPSGTATGRRVFLPWGWGGGDFNTLSADGQTIMQRSIEWCLLPVAHWKLNDAAGTMAVDWIGGYNGSLIGPTWTTGKLAGGLAFDGSTDYVSIPDATAFKVTSAMTIAGWIKASNWPADGNWASPILRKGDANPCNWQLEVSAGQVALCLDDFDLNGIRGSTTLATNAWHHVAGTWDGTNVRIYVKGVLDNTPTARAAPIGTDTRVVYLGGRSGGTDITNGTLDDVRFYNRCLTAAEIAELANVSPTIKTWTQVNPNP